MKKLLMLSTGFVAVTAIPCGLLMMIKPDGSLLQLELNLLSRSLFPDYFVPGIALAFFAGGVNLVALIKLWKRKTNAMNWAVSGGLMIIVFEIVQISSIRIFDWLQLLYLLIGFCIVLMSLQIKHKELI